MRFAISFEKAYNGTTAEFYRDAIADAAKKLGLTISGRDYPPVRRGLVPYCTKGNLMTVGSAKTHDVEWIERLGYAAEKGIEVVFDGIRDYNEIVEKLVEYAEKKYGYRLTCGNRVTFHKGFVKIGHVIISNSELYKLWAISRARSL